MTDREAGFRTEHRLFVRDARAMKNLPDESVELVVTSPPYPMIDIWDETFAAMNPDIDAALDRCDGDAAFELMHAELARVWSEVARVLRDGGVACINVGDATRTVDGTFQLYPNHAAVIEAFRDEGLSVLPDVLWRKPTNGTAKFMGSGTIPSNAYVTLEHEYILIFRKGGTRRFEPRSTGRYESAYFWEERNTWFSDVWTDVNGTYQSIETGERERSGAFPLTIPYRLINMYSVYGDLVLDPFWGTGTTTLAAMLAGRNSVGYEIDAGVTERFDERVEGLPERSRKLARERLDRHREFLEGREEGDGPAHEAKHHDFGVITSQESHIRLYTVDDVERIEDSSDGFRHGSDVSSGPACSDDHLVETDAREEEFGYVVDHVPVDETSTCTE